MWSRAARRSEFWFSAVSRELFRLHNEQPSGGRKATGNSTRASARYPSSRRSDPLATNYAGKESESGVNSASEIYISRNA